MVGREPFYVGLGLAHVRLIINGGAGLFLLHIQELLLEGGSILIMLVCSIVLCVENTRDELSALLEQLGDPGKQCRYSIFNRQAAQTFCFGVRHFLLLPQIALVSSHSFGLLLLILGIRNTSYFCIRCRFIKRRKNHMVLLRCLKLHGFLVLQ